MERIIFRKHCESILSEQDFSIELNNDSVESGIENWKLAI